MSSEFAVIQQKKDAVRSREPCPTIYLWKCKSPASVLDYYSDSK